MSCSPDDLWLLAKQLASDTNAEEAQKRCAISRGYYAAFHAARGAFPESKGIDRDRNESSHGYLIRRITEYAKNTANVGRREAAVIASRLDAARRERNTADYVLQKALAPSAVVEALRKDELILKLCAEVRRLRQAMDLIAE